MSDDEQLRAIYAQLPTIQCKRLCQECCGPIAMTPLEHRRIQEVAGERWQGRAMLLSGRSVMMSTHHGDCNLLEDGACSVYDRRPLVCRIWGVVKAMRCPHGCTPSFWLSASKSSELFARLQALSDSKDA